MPRPTVRNVSYEAVGALKPRTVTTALQLEDFDILARRLEAVP